MNTLLVMNGETDWQEYFPGITVERRRIQASRWLFDAGALWVFDGDGAGALRVEGVLWRLGAIRPQASHRQALELIRLAGVPCVNPAATLLRGYDRLAMLNEVRAAGVPTLPFSVALGERMLETLAPTLPTVLKIGNYHGGFGKARLLDAASWADARDLAFAADDYATVEPYVDYVRDIRCLAVGEQMWAMSRRAAVWKVNAQTASYDLIEPPEPLRAYTLRLMRRLEADTLGVDFLETPEGEFVCLESNDIPGFSGFPREARVALARRMRDRFEAHG